MLSAMSLGKALCSRGFDCGLVRRATLWLAVFLTLSPLSGQGVGEYQADVIVIVDTSASMAQPGMDPERASLLVAKLLSDLVPGRLAVVRLLDLARDGIKGEPTGASEPCDDDPSKTCTIVALTENTFQQIREQKMGALIRDARGSSSFKEALNAHLEQKSVNSPFDMALLASAGVFAESRASLPDATRVLIWLSDGVVPDSSQQRVPGLLDEMRKQGIEIWAIVFGQGETAYAEANHIPTRRAAGPAKLVEAFTDAFRQVVQAPYKIYAPVATQPKFEVKQHIDEAWVIVYGDQTLGDVSVDTPGGNVAANYAHEVWPTAGAYSVAHFDKPAAGGYTVHASGGGPSVTYGVVQRSTIAPRWLGPTEVTSGVPFPVVAALKSSPDGPVIPESDLGEPVTMTATLGDQKITLRDDGAGGDETAGDGRYSGTATWQQQGAIAVELRAENSFLNRTTDVTLQSSGNFLCPGCLLTLDFGTLKAGQEVCRPLDLKADHQGAVPFALELSHAMPAGHAIVLRSGDQRHRPGEPPLVLNPADSKEICLSTERSAGASTAAGERWGELTAVGRVDPASRVPLELRWVVEPLSFWERWGWLILLLTGVLTVSIIIYGYIKPNRFARELALSFTPEYEDLDDQTPMPLKQWRDVKIGFYRDARAFLHSDFRISGKSKGAVALLVAGRNRAAYAKPTPGQSLFRETSDGDWEAVNEPGRRVANGEVYRVGDRGPHFRIASRLS